MTFYYIVRARGAVHCVVGGVVLRSRSAIRRGCRRPRSMWVGPAEACSSEGSFDESSTSIAAIGRPRGTRARWWIDSRRARTSGCHAGRCQDSGEQLLGGRVYQAYDIGGAFQLTNKASQRPIYLQYKRTSRYGWPSGWHRLTGDVARGQTKVDGWYVAPRGYDGVFLRVCRNDPGDRDYCWSSLMYFGKPGGQGGGSGMITGA